MLTFHKQTNCQEDRYWAKIDSEHVGRNWFFEHVDISKDNLLPNSTTDSTYQFICGHANAPRTNSAIFKLRIVSVQICNFVMQQEC